MPLTIVLNISTPLFNTSGSLSVIVCKNTDIILPSSEPNISVEAICILLLTSFIRLSANDNQSYSISDESSEVIRFHAPSIKYGSPCIIPVTSSLIISSANWTNSSECFPAKLSSPITIDINPFIISGRLRIIFPIIGIRLLFKNVLTESARPLSDGLMSSPNARLARTLVAAAFIDDKEPESVEAASLLVVPVIPSSF